MIQIVWEFRAKAGREPEFERRYGQAGDWVRLFRGSTSYRGSTLAGAAGEPRRYLVVDLWTSLADFERFRAERASEYDALDRQCSELCEAETRLGCFELLG